MILEGLCYRSYTKKILSRSCTFRVEHISLDKHVFAQEPCQIPVSIYRANHIILIRDLTALDYLDHAMGICLVCLIHRTDVWNAFRSPVSRFGSRVDPWAGRPDSNLRLCPCPPRRTLSLTPSSAGCLESPDPHKTFIGCEYGGDENKVRGSHFK